METGNWGPKIIIRERDTIDSVLASEHSSYGAPLVNDHRTAA